MADVLANPTPTAAASEGRRDILWAAACGLATAAATIAAILLTRATSDIAVLWAANAVALVGWLWARRSARSDAMHLATTTLGFLIANLAVGNSPSSVALYTAANTLEVLVAYLLVRAWSPNGPDLFSLGGLVRYIIGCCIPAPVLSACLVGGFYWLQGATFASVASSWWLGSVGGFAVIGTVLIAARSESTRALFAASRAAETFAVLTLVVLIALVAFGSRIPLGFMVYPVLLLAAARLRVFGAALAALIVLVISVSTTLHALAEGGITLAVATDQVTRAQLYLAFACLPTLAIAAILDERDRWAVAAKAKQAQAEIASNGKSKLLANVSHEVRTPLNAIIGFGDILLTESPGALNDTQKDLLRTMVSSADQLNALAQDLIDVAKAEAGKLSVAPVRMDVAPVAADVLERVRVKAEEHGATVQLEGDRTALYAMADPMRVAQILTNLTTNAIKYAGRRGPIVVRLYRIGDRVRLEVQDHGPGIPASRRPELFEPFNRLGKDTGAIEGTGIGLNIARRLAELQGGVLDYESDVETGSRFWLEVPAA